MQLKSRKAVLLLIAIGFLLVTGEIASRQYENFYRGKMLHAKIENPHGTGSHRLMSNKIFHLDVSGNPIEINLNSDGMNWHEVDQTKVRKRIAIVGDSFTLGCWSSTYKSSFAGVFESLLDPTEIEVMNFGVGGYGFDDIELQIVEDVLAYDPDVVILASYDGNDFRDTYLGLQKYKIVNNDFVWNDEVLKEKIPEQYFPQKKHSIVERFSLVRTLEDFFDPIKQGEFFDELTIEPDFLAENFWSQKEYPELAIKARDLSIQTLNSISDKLQQAGVQFAIVSLPYKEQIYVNAEETSVYDIHYPQWYVEEFAQHHAIPYLDMLPALREYVRSHDEPIFHKYSNAINDAGHKVIGEQMAFWAKSQVIN
ncbi:SGNH/GDSL hydrolase family protein [Ketobacter sp.]|uniref:SGNH/GDSL hydrolase family protein n=1 Tax=Ketobacter sp. TaxID=2083498 RepID=UPI000F2155C1|nr:SGNH/GDSL hydrolase family protein [Ketobacter sp.]RLU01172.1 MAG: SGNH/GDSL hydrolase family protein [Ketobacter sp.]